MKKLRNAFLLILASCLGAGAAVAADGKAVFEDRCIVCHDAGRALKATKNRDGWVSTIARMKSKGAKVADDEVGAVADYLVGAAGK